VECKAFHKVTVGDWDFDIKFSPRPAPSEHHTLAARPNKRSKKEVGATMKIGGGMKSSMIIESNGNGNGVSAHGNGNTNGTTNGKMASKKVSGAKRPHEEPVEIYVPVNAHKRKGKPRRAPL